MYTCMCNVLVFPGAETGHVFGWGNNEYGQLGVATEDQQVSLFPIIQTFSLHGVVLLVYVL